MLTDTQKPRVREDRLQTVERFRARFSNDVIANQFLVVADIEEIAAWRRDISRRVSPGAIILPAPRSALRRLPTPSRVCICAAVPCTRVRLSRAGYNAARESCGNLAERPCALPTDLTDIEIHFREHSPIRRSDTPSGPR